MEDDGPHKADAILVLGGDGYCTRIIRAGELARAGYAPIVYVSSPVTFNGHEADYTIPCAVSRGFSAALFHALPSNADSTMDESVLLGEFLRSHGVHTLMLVTSNYHTARAARTLRGQNPALTIYAEPAPDPFFTPDGWWKNRSGRKTLLLEWTKTLSQLAGF